MTHYTIEQWQAYIQGDDRDRSSMDVHLLGCDDCLELYMLATATLHDQLPMLANITQFATTVLDQIKPESGDKTIIPKVTPIKKWYTSTFVHYTIAASITIILVGSGVFNQLFDRVSLISQQTERIEQSSISDQLTNKAGDWLDQLSTIKKEGKP